MEPIRVPAGKGIEWIGDGWRAFTAAPGMWIVLTVVWLLIFMATQFVPFVGALAAQLIAPALSGGLLLAARESLAGRPIDVAQLFQPLTDEATRSPMLVLGAVFLVANLAVMLVAGGAAIGTVGMAFFHHPGAMMGPGGFDPSRMDPAMLMQMGVGVLLFLLLGTTLWLLIWILFYYAIPLVLFAGTEVSTAMALSVRGLVRNWLPLLVLSVIWLLLSVLATLPLLLGWLVLLPMTFGAWYATYRDVFPQVAGAPAAESQAMPPGDTPA